MPVPKFFEFFGVFLEALKDGETHSAKEVRETIARKMNLSEADISDMLPSGRQTTLTVYHGQKLTCKEPGLSRLLKGEITESQLRAKRLSNLAQE